MAVKTKWVTIDVDKLDAIFNVMDKINTAAVRGLIDHEGKDLLVGQLRQEIPYTINAEKPDAGQRTEQKPEPKPAEPEKTAESKKKQ